MKQLYTGLVALGILISTTSSQAFTGRLDMSGIQGSAGMGYTDFLIKTPKEDVKLDRGVFLTTAAERGFDFLNLFLTFSLGYMEAEGVANYNYSNLSGSNNYTATDVAFQARMMDLGLGLKFKFINNFWFRPYIEGGVTGGYHEMRYTSKQDVLRGQGNDYKSKDTIMASGTYTEAGVEIQFSERFGIKLAGRAADSKTRPMDTLDSSSLSYRSETFYLSALIGF